jgi:GTP-binding protein
MFKVTSSEFLTSVFSLNKLPPADIPEIAFAGRSNVGKSTLLNTLLGRRRLAQTSSTPGKTRMLNFFCVNERLFFVDLPGYGYAKVAKELRNRWRDLVEPYLRGRKTLMGVICLADCRREPTQSDRQLLDWLDNHQIPSLLVLTKADKLSKLKASLALQKAQQILAGDILTGDILARETVQCSLFSAKTGQGRAEIWRWIEDRLRSFQKERTGRLQIP